MDTQNQNSLYQIPDYVVAYCKGRLTEVVEYLTDTQYARIIRNPDIRVRLLESEKDSQYIRCLVIRRVLPLTVIKNPMLLRAAELEYKTYNGEYPISLQEARWSLCDEYPKTNCPLIYPYSCLNLIRERKHCFKLDFSVLSLIIKERKALGLHGRRHNSCTA